MATFSGGCHCGNLALMFETALDPAQLLPRACQCSFCRRHGARCVSDPEGRVEILVREDAQLGRYRFALATADFLICRRCGVYVGALLSDRDAAWATINVNVLEQAARFPPGAQPVDYDSEDAQARCARRRARWTPARLRGRP
ncbi:MAG TPA: aldehyde-activating protein [Polyangia bacterium]|nr:aldehyde-activating protein [Polyangia bacterium]